MKRLLLIFLLILSPVAFSQETPPPPVLDQDGQLMDSICYVPDELAYLGDGPEGLMNFLMKEVSYPTACMEENIQGMVYIAFLVETDGSLSHIRVTKKVHPLLEAEALRVVNKMPKWNPALKNGESVRTQISVPFLFTLRH